MTGMPGGSPNIPTPPRPGVNEFTFMLASCSRALLLIPLLFFTGCENLLQSDLVAEGKVTAKTGDSPVLDISTPKVVQNGDTVDISGTVTRKPGMDAPIPNGYLLIQLLDAGGNDLDDIWSTWTPADIPTDGA